MNPYDVIARYYDVEHGTLSEDVDMYRQFASRSPGDVLVVGAGTGRVAIPLASLERSVFAVDSSSGMLEVARQAGGDSRGITWLEADMGALDLGRTFGLIIVPFDTFASLQSTDQQRAALRVLAGHLHQDGLLLLDLVNPTTLPTPSATGIVRQRFRGPYAGNTLTIYDSIEIDYASQEMQLHLTYDVSGEFGVLRECADLTVRWLYRFELEHLCTLSGLIVTHVYGGYDLASYEEASPRMIFVVTR